MSLKNIKKRAEYLAKIRNFFKNLDVLQVDTPLAYDYAVTDPFIDVFGIKYSSWKKISAKLSRICNEKITCGC